MKLSSTMQAVVEYMRKHGNEIHRHPGGFWAHKEWNQYSSGGSFGTSSVHALVTRKVAEYCDWQQHRRGDGRFPICARLAPAHDAERGGS